MLHVCRMWFGTFFLRSLWLSLTVALFWLPVLVIFGYGVRFVFEIFQNEPIALGMVIVLSIQPVLVLLAIFAIRGGMMALKVTRGTELSSLGKVVFRIARFNLPREDHRWRIAGGRLRREEGSHGSHRAGGCGLSGRYFVGKSAGGDGRHRNAEPVVPTRCV